MRRRATPAPRPRSRRRRRLSNLPSLEEEAGSRPLLIVLAILLLVAAALAVTWYLTDGTFGFGAGNSQTSSGSTGGAGPQTDGRPPVEVARATLNSALPQVACTWLDIGDIQAGPPVAVAMRGVAGNSSAAQNELGQALTRAGLANASLSFADVASITPAGCSALDTYRQIRNDGVSRISTNQTRYEMAPLQSGQYAGQPGATVVLEINPGNAPDFALVGIEPSGVITTLIPNRDALLAAINALAARSATRAMAVSG